jgi:hypothetical protein
MFFWFQIFLTWQFLLAGKKNENSMKNVNYEKKNLPKNWDQKFEKQMLFLMSKNIE